MVQRAIECANPRLGERGLALVVALLALLVLGGIATAAVAAAVGQLRTAGMAGRLMAGRAAARGGVERALVETRRWPSAAVGDSALELTVDTSGAGPSWRVYDLRIAREFHVFVAEADRERALGVRQARMVWWLEPESRIAAHRAVVESDSVVVAPGARVDAGSLLARRPGIPACHRLPLLAAAFGGPLVRKVGGLPQPPEWGAGRDGADFADLRLGWFGRSMLAELADNDLTGDSVLAPGCPDCRSGLVFGSGYLRLVTSGAGLLVVDGDLVLASGSSWTGLVLVSGNVAFDPGSGLVGLVRGGGVVTLAGGSIVDGSACAALEALEATTSLARPIPSPARSWLGPLPPGTE